MKTVPTTTQSNPYVKQAAIAFQQPQARQLKCRQYHTYKLCTTPADATSPIYKISVVLKGQNFMLRPPSYAVTMTLLKGNMLMAEHAFPEKAKQTQNHYMQRNLWIVGGMTMKEWVA
eukprot:15327989-Ditylum_brightwellii.AAC.1